MNDQSAQTTDPTAAMSQAAYSHREVPGYTRDTQLSSADWDVYVNDQTKRATIAFRGTDASHPWKSTFWRDMGADAARYFGAEKINSRFKRVDRVTQQVIDKYGGVDNVEVTGHSLGGAEAAYVSDKYKVHATTYNALVTPRDIIRNRAGKEDWSNVTQNITFGDPFSTGGMGIKGGKKNVDYKPFKDELKSIGKDVGNAVLYAGAAAVGAVAMATGVGEIGLGAAALFEGATAAEGLGLAFEGGEALTAVERVGATAEELEPLLGTEGQVTNRAALTDVGKRTFVSEFKKNIKATAIPQSIVEGAKFGYDTTINFHSIDNYTKYPLATADNMSTPSHKNSSHDLIYPSSSYQSQRVSSTSFGIPMYTGYSQIGIKKPKKHRHPKKHKKK